MPPALEAQYPNVLALTTSPHGTPSSVPGEHVHFALLFLLLLCAFLFLPYCIPVLLLGQHIDISALVCMFLFLLLFVCSFSPALHPCPYPYSWACLNTCIPAGTAMSIAVQ